MQRIRPWLCLLLVFGPCLECDAGESLWSAEKKNHWAWKVPARPTLPTVQDRAWVRNPIDAFILAKLEAVPLKPASPASRVQLLRRATFDLIGLPPTLEEVDAFITDPSVNAWEKVIDRLLASPHYGERWGRHWLDIARYAESNGYEFDEPRPNAWRYRDYVIQAFNDDRPYDRFIKEQLAGDELAPNDPQAWIATGFNLLGPDMTDASSQAQRRQNTLDDMTETAGLAFLGLTVGCARCHNHKFEPITQSDFFRMQAFFAPAEFRKDQPVLDATAKAARDRKVQAYHALTKETQTQIDAIEAPHRDRLYQGRFAKLSDADRQAHLTPEAKRTGAQKEMVANTARRLVVTAKEIEAALTNEDRAKHGPLLLELKKHDLQKPPPMPTAMVIAETGKTPKTFLLRRGELRNPGSEVLPGWLTVLSPGQQAEPAPIKPISATSTGRRTALANWIARADNPLTARVMVNRLWQHHFGRGIVATPSDFGIRGQRPTHPELLDWLATEFVARNWSLKQMHRLMLTSSAYQQSTVASNLALRNDPDNHLLIRLKRLRLQVEIVLDSLFAVSGLLNRSAGGPSALPPLPSGASTGGKEWKVSTDLAEHRRRSVYIFARRNLRFPFLEPFDVPDSNQSCSQRERSTTAPQALALLNSAEVTTAAKALAARIEREPAAERINHAYRLLLSRTPSESETRLARDFLREAPLSELCRALMNVNEFVYLD